MLPDIALAGLSLSVFWSETIGKCDYRLDRYWIYPLYVHSMLVVFD